MPTTQQPRGVGPLLRQWRSTRGLSQLELALQAGVSAKHLSFLETGRAKPSREMLLALATTLDVPLRERNVLLNAAGFAPAYRETSLAAPEMAQVRAALEMVLAGHDPFGAMAFDARGDIVMSNASFARFLVLLLGDRRANWPALEPLTLCAPPRLNMFRLVFDPAGLRPAILNWDTVARSLLQRLAREVRATGDPALRAVLAMASAFPGVPEHWRSDPDVGDDLVIASEVSVPVEVAPGRRSMKLFSTITTLGTAQDITLQELRIESYHPADAATAAFTRLFGA